MLSLTTVGIPMVYIIFNKEHFNYDNVWNVNIVIKIIKTHNIFQIYFI